MAGLCFVLKLIKKQMNIVLFDFNTSDFISALISKIITDRFLLEIRML
jgi:hypothetical protein